MNKDQFIQACISAMKALAITWPNKAYSHPEGLVKQAVNLAEALREELDGRKLPPSYS